MGDLVAELHRQAGLAARPSQMDALDDIAYRIEEHRRHCTANTCCLEDL